MTTYSIGSVALTQYAKYQLYGISYNPLEYFSREDTRGMSDHRAELMTRGAGWVGVGISKLRTARSRLYGQLR